MPETDQIWLQLQQAANGLPVLFGIGGEEGRGFTQARSESDEVDVGENIAGDGGAIAVAKKDDVAGRVPWKVQHAPTVDQVAVMEDLCNRMRRSGEQALTERDCAAMGQHRCAAFHGGCIALVASERDAELPADRGGGALVIGVAVSESDKAEGASAKLTHQPPTPPACAGVDENITDEVDVDDMAREAGE